MSKLRESVGSTLATGNLTHNPNEECGADRVGALAFADGLGAAVWRVIATNDASAFRGAVNILHRQIHRHEMDCVVSKKLARRALIEYLDTSCRVCEGRRFIYSAAGVKRVCVACNGSGRHENTDRERAAYMGMKLREFAPWKAVLEAAKDLISTADARAGRQISKQLERRRPAKPRRSK